MGTVELPRKLSRFLSPFWPCNSKPRRLFKMAPPPEKKAKVQEATDMSAKLKECRKATAENIEKFKFNMKRVKHLTGNEGFLHREAKGVAYYMHRDQRLQDNWAALFAQKLALADNLPLYIIAGISAKPGQDACATRRHIDFSMGGLQEVAEECSRRNIEFHLLTEHDQPTYKRILDFMEKSKVGCIVADFSPLKPHREQVDELKKGMEKLNGPCLYQVDAHNVVPVWEASEKQEYAARTIRNKIMNRLNEFLTEFPPIIHHPVDTTYPCTPIDWDLVKKEQNVDETVQPVSWAKPGTLHGYEMLESFVTSRIKNYSDKRNDPNVQALSNLSPWFHFGQLSVQRSVLYVKKSAGSRYGEAVKSFVEESVVRSELSDDFCYYQKNYDKIEGGHDWAVKTLNDHRKDKREYLYTQAELDDCKTHDELWNSAQIQLKTEGKMHGFMRMYWAKKILEWTESPEKALEIALYFNDHYSLDGADSNGFVGCMWSIVGIHDQGWAERAVFGKIRYMNYAGCKRKFDISKYVAKYGAKSYPVKKQK